MIFAIVLLCLLGLSMLVNLSQLAGNVVHGRASTSMSSARFVGPRLDEAILEDNNAPAKIAVIDVNGVITGSPVDQDGYSMVDIIKAQLDRAQDDRRVKAVIMRVDSPGGEVLASDEISDAIKNFQAGRKSNGQDEQKSKAKPVIVSMGNLAASGGYPYPASQTPWQEIQRASVGQLERGAILEGAEKYQRIAQTHGVPRDNH